MRTLTKATMIAVFLALLAVATGCEDSPVAIGKDFQMYILANPTEVDVDPDDPPDPLPTSTIIATVVNDTGIPQKGVNVYFTTTSGALASNTQPVTTDGNGNAYDVLTFAASGPAEATVTATATSLSQSVKITNTGGICSTNSAPVAHILPHAPQTLAAGETATTITTGEFSGLTSTDSGGSVASYSWTCFDGDTPTTGPTKTCTYTYDTTEKTYTISLVVTDNGISGHADCELSSAPDTVVITVPKGTDPAF